MVVLLVCMGIIWRNALAGEEGRGKGEDPAVKDENPAVVAGDKGDQLVMPVDSLKLCFP